MNNDVTKYHELLDELKLSDPTPPELQKLAIKTSEKDLKTVLKKTGYYSFLFGLVLFVLFLVRNLGIKISFFGSKVILSILSVNIVVTLIIGGKYAKEHFFPEPPPPKDEDKVQELNKKVDLDSQILQNQKQKIKYKKDQKISKINVGISNFTGSGKNPEIVTKIIGSNLEKILGNNSISYMKNQNYSSAAKVVMGSVRNVADTHYINIRLVDRESSKIELILSEEAKSDEEINDACNRITKSIAEYMKEMKVY